MNKTIIYIMDPLCGWCYGFSDVIRQFRQANRQQFSLQILPGGMWIDDEVRYSTPELASYIAGHNRQIEQVSGKRFGANFEQRLLQTPPLRLDSFPASKALVIAQQLQPESALDYLRLIQQAFFVEGRDPNDGAMYVEAAKQVGIATADFSKSWVDPQSTAATRAAFAKAASFGALSFPTIAAEINGQNVVLAQGFQPLAKLQQAVERQLNAVNA